MRNRVAGGFAMLVILAVGAYAYLYPGGRLLFAGSRTEVMSDDTDVAPLPFVYDAFLTSVRQDPALVFYGAVATNAGNPEHPAASWMSVSERAIVLALAGFVPLEQLSTAVAFVLLILTGLSFYALARAWGWSFSVAAGLALAWAFCPFTRARAKVHVSMVGTYHLPLILLGLWLVARRRDRRSVAAAALCFFAATTTIHYFVITAAALSPLFLAYVLIERRRSVAVALGRLVAATLPAILWLGWSLTHAVPSKVNLGGDAALPQTGGPVAGAAHPFLWTYAARPLDYLGSDVYLTESTHDWIIPKELVNQRTRGTLDHGNPHERTNGIRYLILALASVGAGLGFARARGRDRARVGWWLAFALACFWLSLNPDYPAPGLGASGWLQHVVAQMRVPSRAGIGVHFALLCLAGLALARNTRGLRWLGAAGVLPALVIIEYPPFVNPEPTAVVRPAYAGWARGADDACGTGLLFPVVTDDVFPGVYYHFKQRLRGTGCTFVNALTRPDAQSKLLELFPTSVDYVRGLDRNLVVVDRLADLAHCAHLNFVAFDPVVPARVRDEFCGRMGWAVRDDLTCGGPPGAVPYARGPAGACL